MLTTRSSASRSAAVSISSGRHCSFPPRSEVLISALTIPDMARIVQSHGLVPVPVDLDVGTAAPNMASLRRAITPVSRAVVVAHLFGTRIPMDPIVAVAKEHGLLVVEDCAQAFDGGYYHGHRESDVVMFSFGPIKTATALGGGVFRVRNPELLQRMRELQSHYPLQGRLAYLRRVLKYAMLKAISSRPFFTVLTGFWTLMGYDFDRFVNRQTRGFPGPEFLRRIRQQPSTPLLAVLDRRLRRYDLRRLERRTSRGQLMASLLGGEGRLPGHRVARARPLGLPDPGREPGGGDCGLAKSRLRRDAGPEHVDGGPAGRSA